MTRNEREQEAQRLMAILDGSGETTMITEDGAVEEGPHLKWDGPMLCCHCLQPAALTGRRIEAWWFCEGCARIANLMSRTQCACPICRGKTLMNFAAAPNARPQWRACYQCEGKGWITLLLLDVISGGVYWPTPRAPLVAYAPLGR